MFRSKKPIPEKLHICMIAAHFPLPGASEEPGFLWPVARGLARQGHQVTVLSFAPQNASILHTSGANSSGEFTYEGVRIIYLGTNKGLGEAAFGMLVKQTFLELHQQQPFHIIHSLDSGAAELGDLKDELGLALMYDVEATQMSQIFSILGMGQENLWSLLSTGINVSYKFLTTYLGRDRRLLKDADGVFVTTPPQRLALERYYLYPELKTHLVPYGLEIGDLSPRERSQELKKKLNIPDNGQVVATVSDMTELAETLNLMRAFEKVAIKRPSSRLIIVGNGPLFKQIEFECLSLALGSRVIFTGAVESHAMADYISLADVFVSLSARTSGFERSLLEAMAQKKVVIGSEVSPISTLIEDSVDGFLIRPADIQSLSTLIQQVFNGEIDHTAIGERARGKVVHLFDSERMVQQTLNGYLQALKASGHFKRTA